MSGSEPSHDRVRLSATEVHTWTTIEQLFFEEAPDELTRARPARGRARRSSAWVVGLVQRRSPRGWGSITAAVALGLVSVLPRSTGLAAALALLLLGVSTVCGHRVHAVPQSPRPARTPPPRGYGSVHVRLPHW